MKIAVDWLNEYLTRKLNVREAADAMELAGIEVEEVVEAAPLDKGLIAGQVVEVKKHPGADKLKLAKVDVGKTTLSIVCGAPNVAVGQKVVVATIGSVLPAGTEIKSATIRGEVSEGMLCSAHELCLSHDHSGVLVLADEVGVGTPVRTLIKLNDVIDTSTAANRWDLNGIVGVAREVAAQTGQKLQIPESEQLSDSGSLKVHAPVELSSRYMLARLKVDPANTTPEWMANHLKLSGIRPVGIVVDITNYVMVEYGQPMHAFDAASVSGDIVVRKATKGEKLTTLDGASRELSDSDIVIADNRQAIGLAGVMGGQNSEITGSTTEILLESASFDPASLRKTALRLGLRTDASARFERGIPPELPPIALARAITLLQKHAGAELLAGPADTGARTDASSVTVQTADINRLLGLKLTTSDIAKCLSSLGFENEAQGDGLQVIVPWWRPDVKVWEDLAEEVIKMVGYESLPATLPAWAPAKARFDRGWSELWRAKAALRSLGLFEVVSYSFISAQQIESLGWDKEDFLKLKNPLSQEQAYLRSDLLPSMLAVTAANSGYSDSFGIFEFSKVYHPQGKGKLPHEILRLGVMTLDGYRGAKSALDRLGSEFNCPLAVDPRVFDVNVAHPSRSGVVKAAGQTVGVICQLHPTLAAKLKLPAGTGYLELDWEAVTAHSRPAQYREVSRFPTISRDLTLLVEREVTWSEISAHAGDPAPQFISDFYGQELPEGKKTITLRYKFSASDRTLTDTEADNLLDERAQSLRKRFKAEIR